MSGPVWAECGEAGGRRRIWRTRSDWEAYNARLDYIEREYGRRRRAALAATDLRAANAWRRREMRCLERYYVVVEPATDRAAIERQPVRGVALRHSRRTGTRARGAGRPAARRTRSTTSSSSSSSSDDPGPSDPPPAPADPPSLAPRTQSDRVLAVLRRVGDRGTSAADWLLPQVIDDGRPILSLAARVADLRRDGHRITSQITKIGDAHLAVYRLIAPPNHSPSPRELVERQGLLEVGEARRRPSSHYDEEVA
jgi:hypothetical protein